MKVGYIRKYNLELNPQLTERFKFIEATFTRHISSRSDRIHSKIFSRSIDYEEIVDNANMMKELPGFVIVSEPFLLDDELRERAIRWVKWANKAAPSEYDLFLKLEKNSEV